MKLKSIFLTSLLLSLSLNAIAQSQPATATFKQPVKITEEDLKAVMSNKCPELSQFKFVYFEEESLKCSDLQNIISVNADAYSILPALKIPSFGILAATKSDNAMAEAHLMRVPLRLENDEQASSEKERIQVAQATYLHELGHMYLFAYLRKIDKAHNKEVATLIQMSRLRIETNFLQGLIMKEMNKAKQEFVTALGKNNIDELNEAEENQVEDFESAFMEVNNSLIETRMTKTDELMDSYSEEGAYAYLMPYHELFADVVTVLYFNDWSIMSKTVAIAYGSDENDNPDSIITKSTKEAISYRDFSNPVNEYANWEATAHAISKENPHSSLSPVRYAIYKKFVIDNKCKTIDRKNILSILLEKIASKLAYANSEVSKNDSVKFDYKIENPEFINTLNKAFDDKISTLCQK